MSARWTIAGRTRRPLAEVAAAVALLTRVPVEAIGERAGGAAFGLVGGVLGLVAAPALLVLGPVAPFAAGLAAVGLLAVSSGSLHLDGLADTADALAAPTAEGAERARRDPRVGAAGVVAIVIVIGLDAALLSALLGTAGTIATALIVVVAGSVSRASAALAPSVVNRPARDGLGRWFADRTTTAAGLVAASTSLVASAAAAALTGMSGPLEAAAVGLVFGIGAARILGWLRDGLDGDGLGAVVEVTFAATLLAAVLAP
ncbi:MAG: adenosylcobinamide-GDP ribazoletransferase [Chloroflexota bacterium]